MKTIILSAAVAVLFSVSNISMAVAGNNKQIYSDKKINTVENTVTVTYYEGENDQNLTPVKKTVTRNDANNNPNQKDIYRWSETEKKWKEVLKYEFVFDESEKLHMLSYTGWDNETNDWDKDIQHLTFLQNTNSNNMLTVNYIDCPTVYFRK